MAEAATGGALAGIKVIDLSRVLGGPYCTQMLADHGAEVIKVEPPQGDETRLWGPPFDAEGISAYFAGINRNKRTIALDLAKPAGRDVLLKLGCDEMQGHLFGPALESSQAGALLSVDLPDSMLG